jgi:hypothetical protein
VEATIPIRSGEGEHAGDLGEGADQAREAAALPDAIEVDALGSEKDVPGCFRFNVLQDEQDENVYFSTRSLYRARRRSKLIEPRRTTRSGARPPTRSTVPPRRFGLRELLGSGRDAVMKRRAAASEGSYLAPSEPPARCPIGARPGAGNDPGTAPIAGLLS